ncbi:class I SAM-dependent DNA methyltransferase [Methylobacterium sp. A54F]
MTVEAFIARWTDRIAGAERANYQMFLTELCDVLDVPRPEPAGERARNDYVFERAVRPRPADGGRAPKRIDLYRRACFILEAKQSHLPGRRHAGQTELELPGVAPLGRPGAARGWDAMMQNARKQAEGYVFLLDPDHPAPPFLIICDVGHCLEVYADFTGTGRAYTQFPDRQTFRIFLEDLRRPGIRQRLARVWTDPRSLDPARESARVTQGIARRLAAVSRVLEARHPPEAVAHFLMRCIFTMFAEDVDLLPRGAFTEILTRGLENPEDFARQLADLWARMDDPDRDARYSLVLRTHLRHFNGNLFRGAGVFRLGREEIGELLAAAGQDWREVDPAIFGTLLEQALDRTERRRLGAHYTPRAYVQRLVEVTVMEPLRGDWQAALTRAEAAKEDGDEARAVGHLRAFHRRLCASRVLDPACGTGNFLYVALELMKRLEGEVLEALAELGEPENMGLDRETVDPHQFLGLERNPRAAAIAELVVWIGYLQQHYRTRSGHPAEPILRAFRNINGGARAGFDALLAWDEVPEPDAYPNPRQAPWPEAAFIVGNPPFVGGKDIRARLGTPYAQALRAAHPHMKESADLVMYWWDRAAELLARPSASLRRFGFVTTNSIAQVFQRRVVERHLAGRPPVSIVFAVPDHPWTKATRDAAAVRIAMTAAAAGTADGTLSEVVAEAGLDTDDPAIGFAVRTGRINADLTIGLDATRTVALGANSGLCSPGVKLHGAGFIVSRAEAEHLGLGRRPGLERHLRPYRNGRDLTARSRDAYAIDLLGLAAPEVRRLYPEVYQHLLARVRPGREANNRAAYRESWWLFGEPRRELRPALAGLPRYIATVETAKHRVFQFLDAAILPDNMLVVIADDDAATLALLSSRIHTAWALQLGGWLGYGNDPRYTKSRCFDPFPFPSPTPVQLLRLRGAGAELDATRRAVLERNPDLTLTGLYNVLERVRADAAEARDADVIARGRVLILHELHRDIDRLTAEAYGWPQGLEAEAIVARLVALNAERVREEAAGLVRWLRPDYQAPRFVREAAAAELDLGPAAGPAVVERPAFPRDRDAQPLAVEALLAGDGRPMAPDEIARGFLRGGRRIEARVAQILATLALYGRISDLGDGRYAARRAA